MTIFNEETFSLKSGLQKGPRGHRKEFLKLKFRGLVLLLQEKMDLLGFAK